MAGTIRIGNKRANSQAKPQPGETIIQGDRKNPMLGNPFILKDHMNPQERAGVIDGYRHLYKKDWEQNGRMRKYTEDLAARVAAGENIILMCWCVGPPHNHPCHLNFVKARIEDTISGIPGDESHYKEAEGAHDHYLHQHSHS
jgi:Domain of unknown function (DUF4326)